MPLDSLGDCVVLRKVLYILGELDDGDLQWILDSGLTRRVSAETVLIREGDVHQDKVFIVVDGELAILREGHEIARLGPGEIVGEMSLLDDRPPNATVRAARDSVVFVVPHSRIKAKVRVDQGFSSRFHRALCVFLANRLSRTDAMIGSGGRVSAETPDRMDEISDTALRGVALAGARFDWFLHRARGF